jgi:hypothetical protein
MELYRATIEEFESIIAFYDAPHRRRHHSPGRAVSQGNYGVFEIIGFTII